MIAKLWNITGRAEAQLLASRTLIVVLALLSLIAIGAAAVRIFYLPARLWTWGPSMAEMFWQLHSLSDPDKLALDNMYRQSEVALSVFADKPRLRDEYDYVLSRRADLDDYATEFVDQARIDEIASSIALDLIWRLEAEYVLRAPTIPLLEYFRQKLSLMQTLYIADSYSALCDEFVRHIRSGQYHSMMSDPYYGNVPENTFRNFFSAFNTMVRAARDMPDLDIDGPTHLGQESIGLTTKESTSGDKSYTICEQEMMFISSIFDWMGRTKKPESVVSNLLRAKYIEVFRNRLQHPYSFTPFDSWRIVL